MNMSPPPTPKKNYRFSDGPAVVLWPVDVDSWNPVIFIYGFLIYNIQSSIHTHIGCSIET